MKILLVDDDSIIRLTIGGFLRQLGHEVHEAEAGTAALNQLAKFDFALVITDIKMPGMSGIQLLKQIQSMPLTNIPKVVLFTGHGDMESAIEALRTGAYDYLLKPVTVDDITKLVNKVAEYQEYSDLNTEPASCKQNELDGVFLYSEAMAKAVIQARKYHTDRSIPVLIQGETGTGKEVIARIIHNNGADTSHPFLDLNCGAIPSNLFESELFGYEPGAFTGGLAKGKKGIIEAASGGTLFLDEIGDMPLELQVKLLRVLQEKTFYRVGGTDRIKADVRIICATNADLQKKVNEGQFRKDLFYRLRVGQIILPALRDCKEAIYPIAVHFLRSLAQDKQKLFRGISNAARELLESYDWPGNVRELKGVLEWAVFMHNDLLLQPQHLTVIHANSEASPSAVTPKDFRLPDDEFPLDEFVNAVINKALHKHNGNKAAAARYLKLSRRTLYGRYKELT